jgi:glycosyltransferase involved in cell wall biosynthesis
MAARYSLTKSKESQEIYRPRLDNFIVKNRLSITFVLPALSNAGGVLSVLNLVNELILIGIDCKIVTLNRSDHEYNYFSIPILFLDHDSMLKYMPKTNLYVATLWSTAHIVYEVAKDYNKNAAYFIQDYEVWFYPESDSKTREMVRNTYKLINNKFAKTEWIIKKINKEGFHCDKIPPGLNLNTFYPLDRSQVTSDSEISIICMYRPETPRRGSDILIKALDHISSERNHVKIRIFGEKPDHKLPFLYDYLGKLDHKQLAHHYRRSDIFIDPSYFQGFGRTGLEAMACGCACILTNSGGINEYANDGQNTIIAKVGDPEDIARKTIELIDNAKLRDKLSRLGINTAKKYPDRIAAEHFLQLARKWCRN